jgi:Fe-Mn family superoxide dismutase
LQTAGDPESAPRRGGFHGLRAGSGVAAAGAPTYLPVVTPSSAARGAIPHARPEDLDKTENLMTFTLPELPYAYDALAPYMSKETLEFHHDKHHKAYVDTGNKLLEGTGLEGKSVEEIVTASYGNNQPLFNNAGQHFNHLHFWQWMKPNGGGAIPGSLAKKIDEDLGGAEKFKADFIQAGIGQFGSGWAWLAVKDGKLAIMKTPNGENPLVHGAKPILGVDVWEHSYYIDYRNRRPDYLKAFLENLVNWEHVETLYGEATA